MHLLEPWLRQRSVLLGGRDDGRRGETYLGRRMGFIPGVRRRFRPSALLRTESWGLNSGDILICLFGPDSFTTGRPGPSCARLCIRGTVPRTVVTVLLGIPSLGDPDPAYDQRAASLTSRPARGVRGSSVRHQATSWAGKLTQGFGTSSGILLFTGDYHAWTAAHPLCDT